MGHTRSQRRQLHDDRIRPQPPAEPDEDSELAFGPDLSRDNLLDVFRDDEQDEPQPEHGDFWFEADDEED